jgi:hypothetical protein
LFVLGTWQQADKDGSGVVPDSGVHLEPNGGGSALYSEMTEDPGGYLEPVSIRVDSGMDYDMIHGGDMLSNIEGSVVDSDYLFNTAPKSLAPTPAAVAKPLINIDKYKIHGSNEQKRPISLVSEEKCGDFEDSEDEDSEAEMCGAKKAAGAAGRCCSDYDDLCRHKGRCCNDYEDLPLMDQKEEADDDDDDDDDDVDDDTLELKKKLKRLSSDSGNVDTSSSLNDLNKDDGDEGLNLSAPNIAKQATLKKDNRDEVDSHSSNGSGAEGGVPSAVPSEVASEAVAIDKLKKALSASNEGLIQLYHGKPAQHRLSQDTQDALNAHQYRMSSSDC